MNIIRKEIQLELLLQTYDVCNGCSCRVRVLDEEFYVRRKRTNRKLPKIIKDGRPIDNKMAAIWVALW